MAGRSAPRVFKRRHQHAGVDGNDAALVGEHGIEIEFAQLRHVGGKLRQLGTMSSATASMSAAGTLR